LEERTVKIKKIIEILENTPKSNDFKLEVEESPIKTFETLLPDIRTCMDKSK